MMRPGSVLFATLLACCVALATSQGSCTEDVDCRVGHFCEIPDVYECRECLSCHDLKRVPPRSPQSCIKSIRECGPCLEGLVEDRRVDLNCVPPIARDRGGASPATEGSSVAWIIAGITIALVFVVALAAIFIRYMSCNSVFKFNVDTNIDATLPTRVVVTAPEAPPPYSQAPPPEDPPQPDEDTSRPLIKPYQPPYPAYESQDYQNVSVFNPPAYVRLNGLRAKNQDENDNYNPPAVHDEDTSPSAWTPGQPYNETATEPAVNVITTQSSEPQRESENAGDFSTALAIARNTDLIQSPPVTLRMQALGSSEETNSEDDTLAHQNGNGASGRTARNGNCGINVMNVNQIITIIKPPH